MRANAQCDGRPVEYRWRPLFNAAVWLTPTTTASTTRVGWLVGWGLAALLTQNRSYRACKFVGIFYSKL